MISITVNGAKASQLFQGSVGANTTVAEFRKIFLEKSQKLRKLNPNRVRLTIGDGKDKVALTDKTKELGHYIKNDTATL
jgi:hypothetical protein